MKRPFVSLVVAFSLTACSDDPASPGSGDLITLTQSQAVAVIEKVESFGAQDASLRSLSDTVDVVVKAGAQARRIDVTSDIGNGPYWAVSLQIFAGTTSTFHVIAFDDPSNPTRFIILGGAVLGSATPVTSATGSIGTNGATSLTGHLYSLSGNSVSGWHAGAGTSSFTLHPTTQACPAFNGPGNCVSLTMDATFNFTSQSGSTTGQPAASGSALGIPGVRLSP